LFLFSCKTKETALTGYNHPDSLFASIERSPCFGRCPVYKAIIYNNGKATYEGRSSVVRQGLYHGTATSEQLEILRNSAESLRLDTLGNEYVQSALTDFPAQKLSIVVKGTLKNIFIRHTEPPGAIMQFEKLLDEEIEKIQWEKVADTDN
jgi:hypothetical protein